MKELPVDIAPFGARDVPPSRPLYSARPAFPSALEISRTRGTQGARAIKGDDARRRVARRSPQEDDGEKKSARSFHFILTKTMRFREKGCGSTIASSVA